MSAVPVTPTLEQQRAETFLALGFDATQAFLLATTRQDGTHVDAGRVRDLLMRGCTHATAVRILL